MDIEGESRAVELKHPTLNLLLNDENGDLQGSDRASTPKAVSRMRTAPGSQLPAIERCLISAWIASTLCTFTNIATLAIETMYTGP